MPSDRTVPVEGELHVILTWNRERVTSVDVRSTRTELPSRLARGQRSATVVDLVSSLHAVCSAAHRAVAATACDVARDGTVDAASLRARERIIAVEAIQEHCTRLGVDWPETMHAPPLIEFVRAVRAATRSAVQHGAMTQDQLHAVVEVVVAHCTGALFGMTPHEWLAVSRIADLVGWRHVPPARWWHRLTRVFPQLGCCAVGPMPRVDARALREVIAPRLRSDRGFARCPDWSGQPVETGALARQCAHPLVADAMAQHGNCVATRLLARLTDLAALLDREDASPALVAYGHGNDGYAGAQTARGLLVHHVVLRQDIVDDYAIVAPTEWNFHPRGALVQGLARCIAANEAEVAHAGRVLAQALDPCVRCTVEVAHA